MGETSGQPSQEMTTLIRKWQAGDGGALDELLEILDTTFQKMTQNEDEALSDSWFRTTDLLNEAFVSLLSGDTLEVDTSRHFFKFISNILRNLLMDEIRKLETSRPGKMPGQAGLEDHHGEAPTDTELILAVHENLDDLRHEDETTADVVNLRFFFGYSIKKVSEILKIPFIQANRRWMFAKVWLFNRLSQTLRHEFKTAFNRGD